MDLILKEDGFALQIDGKLLISHSYDDPAPTLGRAGKGLNALWQLQHQG